MKSAGLSQLHKIQMVEIASISCPRLHRDGQLIIFLRNLAGIRDAGRRDIQESESIEF